MDDSELLRYSRHILLPQIDVQGQERLLAARALVVGLGGLGSPVSMYLAACGVGSLSLADGDAVELSNLQRQIVHGSGDLGRPKVLSARDTLAALNPGTRIHLLEGRLDGEALESACREADVVLDCSDNFPTRFAINGACVRTGTPLVSGAATRFEGQVSCFDPRDPASPCYRCLYPDLDAEAETCTQSGVLAPLLGIIGSVQAVEAVKLLLGIGRSLVGRLLLLDALDMDWREMRLRRDPSCPVCGQRPLP